jgi:hypothetical protein
MEIKGAAQPKQACLISTEQKRQIEHAMSNVTRYFKHQTQKAASNLHAHLRNKHGYAKLDQLTTDQLPAVLSDLTQLQTLAHQIYNITHSLEKQGLHWLTHYQPEQVNQLLITQKTALGLIAA